MDETIIARWLVDSDTWSIPKPSEVFPAPTTNEVKITQWQTDEDLWSEVKELTLIRVVVTPTHVYTKQHADCLVEYTATLDLVYKPVKVMLNDAEIASLSLNRSVSIATTGMAQGTNRLALVAEDGAVANCDITLEAEYRTKVERTFTSIDGGYTIRTV